MRFLVCTDVAARGVDIKGLPYVINMTLPDEPENYIHRIGRVGRQDCLGLAVSIVACDGLKEKVRSRRHRTAHIFWTLLLDVLLVHIQEYWAVQWPRYTETRNALLVVYPMIASGPRAGTTATPTYLVSHLTQSWRVTFLPNT